MKPALRLLIPLVCLAAVPDQVAPMIDMARHAPGEFGADALIRVAALETLDKATRIQLLEEAFRRAAEAQQPFKRRAAILKVGGPAGFFERANQQNLDALSLRLRAVEAMLPLDHGKARSLFLEIAPLDLPKVACDAYLVYDVGRFYDVLGALARQSFTAREAAEGEPVRWLARFAGGINAAAQVEPVARMLQASRVGNADFQALITAFGGALSQISGGDRSFTASVTAAGQQIFALVEDAAKRKLSPLALVEGYRAYLVNNLAGERCSDDDLMAGGEAAAPAAAGAADRLGTPASFFNEKLAMPPVLPLRDDELTPSQIQGAATGLRSCQDAQCRQLTAQCRGLIFDSQGAAFSDAQKDSAEWRDRLEQFLASVADWRETTGTPDPDQYREKFALFSLLIGAVPPGAGRERVLIAWLDYVEGSSLQQTDRMSWFLPVNTLIGRVALDPAGTGKFREAIERARDPLIALYMELERAAPRPPEQIMPLM